jgi:hypothetical protein
MERAAVIRDNQVRSGIDTQEVHKLAFANEIGAANVRKMWQSPFVGCGPRQHNTASSVDQPLAQFLVHVYWPTPETIVSIQISCPAGRDRDYRAPRSLENLIESRRERGTQS